MYCYKFFLLILLPTFAWSEDVCTPPREPIHLLFPRGHKDIVCNAHSEYDYHWDVCSHLPRFHCVGHPSTQRQKKYLWKCEFKKLDGYIIQTMVLGDHLTLDVQVIPNTDFHPSIYYILCIMIIFIIVCGCCNHDFDEIRGEHILFAGICANMMSRDGDDVESCFNWS